MNFLKKYYIYIILLILVIILGQLQINAPKPLEWAENYTHKSTDPFACIVLYELLPQHFKQKNIPMLHRSFYQEDIPTISNLIFINNKVQIGEPGTHKLLESVHNGAHVLLSARNIDKTLLDTLGLVIDHTFSFDSINIIQFKDPYSSTKDTYTTNNIHNFSAYISEYDTANTEVISTLNSESTNTVHIRFGSGTFTINTTPSIFSNYWLTEPNTYSIAFNILSYLPAQKTYWDAYYKKGNPKDKRHKLEVIMDSTPLKIAYYLSILGIILYMIFVGKRKQRIIPIIAPLKNDTIHFSKVVGNLYFTKKNHGNLMKKKRDFFLNKIMHRYHLQGTQPLSKEMATSLSAKANVDLSLIEKIFQLLHKENSTEHDLIQVNQLINEFNTKKI